MWPHKYTTCRMCVTNLKVKNFVMSINYNFKTFSTAINFIFLVLTTRFLKWGVTFSYVIRMIKILHTRFDGSIDIPKYSKLTEAFLELLEHPLRRYRILTCPSLGTWKASISPSMISEGRLLSLSTFSRWMQEA